MRETMTASAPSAADLAADVGGPLRRRADHGIGQRHAGQCFHRRQVFGNRVQGMAKEKLAAAEPPAGFFQQVHRAEIGHGVHPIDADRTGRQDAAAALDAAADFGHKVCEHADRFGLIGTEMDGEHLGNEHFQGRQRTGLGAEGELAEFVEHSPHDVRPGDAGRKQLVGQGLARALLQSLPHAF